MQLPRKWSFSLGLLILLVLMVSILVWVAQPTLFREFVQDEMEFPSASCAIRHTGLPIYYRGETLPHNIGLWHPPLYVGSLALWQCLAGDTVAANRLFGFFTLLLAMVGIVIFAGRRWSQAVVTERQRWGYLLALLVGFGVLVTSPLLVNAASLPDIDTQFLPALTVLAFLILFEARRLTIGPRRYWLIFLSVFVLLWCAKLTMPPLLLAAFVVYELVRHTSLELAVQNGPRSWLRCSARVLGHGCLPLVYGVVSFVLFLIVWMGIASVWGVSYGEPFRYLYHSTNNPATWGFGGLVTVFLKSLPVHFRFYAQWLGIPFFLLVVTLLLREVFSPADGLLSRAERFALQAFIVLLTCMYLFLRPAPFGFPKYWPPLVPAVALLVVDLLVTLHREGRMFSAVGLVFIASAVYVARMTSKGLLPGTDFIWQTYFADPKHPLFQMWFVNPVVATTFSLCLLWFVTRRRVAVPLILGPLAVLFGWHIAVLTSQSHVSYSTTYHYGEAGMTQVADYLRSHLHDDDLVIAPKDVGFLIADQYRYIELSCDPRPYLCDSAVHFLVLRRNDFFANTIRATPSVQTYIARFFQEDFANPCFIVLKRAHECSTSPPP